ncbi:NUDIX hydrolase [Sodalis praecaptivus]|uniref:NUDIX hydrolase n=1 Tax=Sodalis praecaptivus TaxID=1239307 RepID=W0HTC5_9GAMM|nr:NUDIX domain-containing protein [Sodalis praecaptivus]AHF75413.1 NUDIX hydrolase [Sodalis praecaptivus]
MSRYVKDMRAMIGHRPLLLAGSNVIILDERGDILLQQRLNGHWGLPGGLLELGESLEETARREVLEETGLTVGNLKFLNIFSGIEYFFTLPNQDQIHVITALYLCRNYRGEIRMNAEESKDLKFMPIEHLPGNTEAEYRHYIQFYLDNLSLYDVPGK